MKLLGIIVAMSLCFAVNAQNPIGAWEAKQNDIRAIWILTESNLTIAYFKTDPATFLWTAGGDLSRIGDQIIINWEFDTQNPENVGTQTRTIIQIEEEKIILENRQWHRVDNGTPGLLTGAWLITGRKRNGDAITYSKPSVRRTMKILSGTHFQWISYNTETKEFFGTGGGTYTTEEGVYTENIEFFSRDNNRVKDSLKFNYEVLEGNWHHSGKSSKGDPIYEIWSKRSAIDL